MATLLLLSVAALTGAAAQSVSVVPSSFSGMQVLSHVEWTFPASEAASGCFVATFSVPDGGKPSDINVTAIPPQPYPATSPWLATAPLHFLECDMNATFKGGDLTASWDLYLINGRFDLAVGLFAGGVNAPKLLAWSETVTVQDKSMYMHGKLARWKNEDEVMVHFQSKTVTGKAAVRWGLSPTSLTNTVPAEPRTYSRDDLCSPSPAAGFGFHEPGFFHRALLQGLPTDGKTVIFFQYGDDELGWSAVRNFTATIGADPTATVNVTLIADMGVSFLDNSSYHWAEPQAWMTMRGMAEHATEERGAYRMIFHSGDVAYATGIETKWEVFETAMDAVYERGTMYHIGLGNHEQDRSTPDSPTFYKSEDSGGECGVAAVNRFPVPVPGAERDVWYSINYGPVHFLMWDTELECGPGSAQFAFIEEDLKAVDRSKTPWVVVFGHRPIYTDNSRDENLSQIEPLLDTYNVTLSLYGHVHNAQLWCPFERFSNGTRCAAPTADGPYAGVIHSVIGNAGMSLSQFPKLDNRTIYHAYEHGYSTMTANATALTFRYYTDVTDTLHYEFTVTQ